MKAHDQDLQIQFHDMTFHDLEGLYVVAKLRRVSSAPVLVGSVADAHASALGRLIDIFRLGTASRNFSDLRAIERHLLREFGVTAQEEWDAYLQEIRRAQGDLDIIEPLLLTPQPGQPEQRIVFHKAEMNDRPYLVTRIGDIIGSPAPVWLTLPKEEQSTLARLRNVFHIGVQGQAFRDFVEMSRKQGQSEAEILNSGRPGRQQLPGKQGVNDHEQHHRDHQRRVRARSSAVADARACGLLRRDLRTLPPTGPDSGRTGFRT